MPSRPDLAFPEPQFKSYSAIFKDLTTKPGALASPGSLATLVLLWPPVLCRLCIQTSSSLQPLPPSWAPQPASSAIYSHLLIPWQQGLEPPWSAGAPVMASSLACLRVLRIVDLPQTKT
eukprot:1145417-Pelagomonas_calceolata.AAC.2